MIYISFLEIPLKIKDKFTSILLKHKKIIFILIRISLIPYIFKEFIQRRMVTIILYHNLDPQYADKHFDFLSRTYNIISLRDYLNAIMTNKLDTLPPKSLIITLDDGHRGNYQLQSVIQKYKLPITIFLCSGIVGTNRHFWWNYDKTLNKENLKLCNDEDRLKILGNLGFNELREWDSPEALTDEEIEELKRIGSIDFQSHTVTHPCLPNCSNQKAEFEISESKKQLENNYHFDIYAFSFPNGDYSDRDIDLAMQAGYKCALTVDPGFNDAKTNPFKLKRLNVGDSADINELIVKTSGFWAYFRRLIIGQEYGFRD